MMLYNIRRVSTNGETRFKATNKTAANPVCVCLCLRFCLCLSPFLFLSMFLSLSLSVSIHSLLTIQTVKLRTKEGQC